MKLINDKPYINLDPFLPINTMPDIKEAVIESYDLIRFSNPLTLFDTNGKIIVKNPKTSDKTYKDVWIREMKTGLCNTPYIFLFQREGKESNNKYGYPWIYDSIIDDDNIWDSFKWLNLPKIWKPWMNWVESLPLKKLGQVAIFLQRPYITPQHHQDHLLNGQSYQHRQEFIRIGMNEKHFHILNIPNEPVQVTSKAIFFNQQNLHGSDQYSTTWTISARIDCVFTDELREKVGIGNIDRY